MYIYTYIYIHIDREREIVKRAAMKYLQCLTKSKVRLRVTLKIF